MADNSADWRNGGFGVYVHWPFCQAKCPYCDFNSHVAAEIDQTGWRDALLSELAHAASLTPGRRVDTVFFGGGTPSLMAPETVAALIEAIRRHWDLAANAEITLEANPTSVEAGRFRAYAAAGVNRLSMGAQALNDADLKALGRLHSAAEARAAFDIARAAFDRVSFDLIYARMGQNPAQWRSELAEALSMAADHLSLYQLTIEPETPFAALHRRGKLALPNDDNASEMYEITQELCDLAGLPAYEISNHAAPGAESRHNLVYWRSGDYAGIGPGAHGRLTLDQGRIGAETIRDPAAWRAAVATKGHGGLPPTPISREEQGEELLLMGLRLAEGISLTRFEALTGAPLRRDRVTALINDGLLWRNDDSLRATRRGRILLNAILGVLAA